ncbi:MAG: hypothetical protein HY335_03010 [Deinococcus sp.]|nr:hypothetical protein [Deinococcus sp.]
MSSGPPQASPITFVFLDGIGLGPAGAQNPFQPGAMPFLEALIGGPLVAGRTVDRPGLLLRPIDASLGIPGLPQSATGQTALFTGINAPAQLGFHLSAYPTPTLQAIIEQHSILKRITALGLNATFANAYTRAYFAAVERGERKHSASTLCVLAAGLPFRDFAHLARGQAVFWDITNRMALERSPHYPGLKPCHPFDAGVNLARLAQAHHLVLYESFRSDLIGHAQDWGEAYSFLADLDHFLAGVLSATPGATLLITSDHGNLEDLSTKTHTLHQVPLLAIGPGAQAFGQVTDLTGVTPAIVRHLSQLPSTM